MPRVLTEERPSELNMTPMIDVVFQLLIFFMLTMRFKDVEGKLLTTLPKDKGQQAADPLPPELREIRVILCAGGDTRSHEQNREAHEEAAKDPAVCRVRVGPVDCGELSMTDRDAAKAERNRERYREIGLRAREAHDMLPSTRDPLRRTPVILDADSEVPYEHVIGIINALKEQELEAIEFAANPRLDKHFKGK